MIKKTGSPLRDTPNWDCFFTGLAKIKALFTTLPDLEMEVFGMAVQPKSWARQKAAV
jgi:hypothetical protein